LTCPESEGSIHKLHHNQLCAGAIDTSNVEVYMEGNTVYRLPEKL
jgi:hypothetical protein